ncbi:hypothetical protein Tco_0334406, partial [Tanacetum coccineum]
MELIKDMVTIISVENRRQLYLAINDKERVRAKCRGLVLVFSNSRSVGDSGSNVDGLVDGPSIFQSKANGLDFKKKKTKNDGDNQKKPVVDTLKCPWLLHCAKPNWGNT